MLTFGFVPIRIVILDLYNSGHPLFVSNPTANGGEVLMCVFSESILSEHIRPGYSYPLSPSRARNSYPSRHTFDRMS